MRNEKLKDKYYSELSYVGESLQEAKQRILSKRLKYKRLQIQLGRIAK